MKFPGGRGISEAAPIEVTNHRLRVATLADGIADLSATHAFSDFDLPNEHTPLFDPNVAFPDLPFSVGAYPEWNRTRPYLTGQHLWTVSRSTPPSVTVDETELVDDLLYVFMGLGGRYLHPVFGQRRDRCQDVRFELKAQTNGSARELLQRMLPLCESVIVMQRFVETRSGMEFGTVCHATAAAVQGIVDDWMLLVTQLESQMKEGKLTLQTLWFYVQPAMSTMTLLARLCRQTSSLELRGTELLNLLHQTMQRTSGSQNAEAVVRKLLAAATVPYFEMLERWLCEGMIDDPYGEFMIAEDPTVTAEMTTSDLRSAYWQNRYRLRKTYLSIDGTIVTVHGVPSFLHHHADVILTTGKYLNAIKECQRPVDRPLSPQEHPTFDAGCSYLRLIQKAHKAASQAFLDMFIKDLKLLEWLRALKHFFLMDQGDMIGHLMDIAGEELSKVASQVAVNRMQSLLELAFKISSLPSDVNTEPLHVELDHRSVVDLSVCLRQPQRVARASVRSRQSVAFGSRAETTGTQRASYLVEELTGWDIFMIGYRVEWPMILIVPPKLMQMYQLLFKQLFVLKRTEYELGKAWKALQRTRILADRSLDGCLRLAEVTCHQMQHTIQQYLRHVTVHTVEPRWIAMETALSKAKDVDGVIDIHRNFIEKVMRQSLLRKLKGVKELDHIVQDSLAYAKFITMTLNIEGLGLTSSTSIGSNKTETSSERRRTLIAKLEAAIKSSHFDRRIQRYRTDYLSKLKQLVQTLTDFCDAEGGDPIQGTESDIQSREDLEKLHHLIETLRPQWS